MADSGSSNTSMQSDVGALRAAAAAGDAEAMLHISASLLSSFPFPSFSPELRAEVSSYHLLASIIQGNVEHAIFHYRTIEELAASSTFLEEIRPLLASLAAHEHGKAITVASDMAKKYADNVELSIPLRKLAECVRSRRITEIIRVYSNITVASVAAQLALTAEEVISRFQAVGYVFDAATGALSRAKAGVSVSAPSTAVGLQALDSLARLGEYAQLIQSERTVVEPPKSSS